MLYFAAAIVALVILVVVFVTPDYMDQELRDDDSSENGD